jgi:broad specificity phosphatase PhoE
VSIFLVRHAETALNAARVVQPFDTPISARGRAQAQRLAMRLLRDSRPAMVLSSDAPRALQTAAPFAQSVRMDVTPDPTLRERDFGVLRGQAYDTLGVDPQTLVEAPADGESLEAFGARVQAAWARLIERHAACRGGDLVVFSHGLWIRTLIGHPGLDPQHPGPGALPNTSVTVIDPGPPVRITQTGCAAHLDETLAGRGVSGI